MAKQFYTAQDLSELLSVSKSNMLIDKQEVEEQFKWFTVNRESEGE